jgi:hypothetical protein
MQKMSYLAKRNYYANWQAGAVIMTIKRGNPSFEMIRFNTDGSFAALGKAFG